MLACDAFLMTNQSYLHFDHYSPPYVKLIWSIQPLPALKGSGWCFWNRICREVQAEKGSGILDRGWRMSTRPLSAATSTSSQRWTKHFKETFQQCFSTLEGLVPGSTAWQEEWFHLPIKVEYSKFILVLSMCHLGSYSWNITAEGWVPCSCAPQGCIRIYMVWWDWSWDGKKWSCLERLHEGSLCSIAIWEQYLF